MIPYQITAPRGFCTYYNMHIREIEAPEFPFVCERMTMDGECPPHCGHYQIMRGVYHAC